MRRIRLRIQLGLVLLSVNVACFRDEPDSIVSESVKRNAIFEAAWFIRPTNATVSRSSILKIKEVGASNDWVECGNFTRIEVDSNSEFPRLQIEGDHLLVKYVYAEIYNFSNTHWVRVNGELRRIYVDLVALKPSRKK